MKKVDDENIEMIWISLNLVFTASNSEAMSKFNFFILSFELIK